MKIAFNPSTVAALIAPPNNKDITFDLRGHNIFARGVKFCGTDTNTWRDIKINNVSIDSNTLDLRDGDNTTLTNINGVVTINSTWRPVVDNLTSDSTTSSLSANLGRVLKALIDGKSDSDHNHDDRYLRLTGGWMSGDINFGGDNKIYWGRNSDSASISFKNDGDGDADSYMSFVTSDNGNEYFRWSHSSGSTNTEWMSLRSDGLRVGGTKVSLEGHSHNDLYYTKTEVNNKLNDKSDTGHTHDNRYLKLTGGIVNGVVGINATGVCGNSVLTVGPQNKRINTGIVDRYGTMLQIVGTGKKNEGGVIGFHNPGLYSAIIGFVRDTNETGFIFDTDIDRNSWYVKARAFKGNLIGDADSVDGVHMDWSTNYTAGNYLAIWDNAGNCIRPIPKGSTSVGYATSAGNADTVDSKHASDFASSSHSHNYAANENYGGFTKSGRLPISGFYQSYISEQEESGGNAPWSSWMHLINCLHNNTGNNYALLIAASFFDNNTFKIRVTSDNVNNAWRDIIHSGNIGSQSVNYANSAGNADTATNAYHLRINSANTWSTWYWAGLSGLPSWLWGSNDGTNMYVWDPNNFNVHTALYLRSLGNLNCQTGRTLNYGDVYSYNTYDGNTGSHTTYSSVIGFGRGTAGTVEIAGGWCNTHLYWRSLRDCCDDWYSWRVVLDSSNYTEFINNYYWANVKISTSSSTTTSPTVSNLTATNSIRMGNISLENTDEINNSANGNLYLNYRNSGNIILCEGGGKVGIGNPSPSYKLDVNGLIRASGFHHSSMDSNNYMLLAGGGYKSFGGDYNNPIFLGYLNLDHGNDGTVSSSFYCLGYSVSFTYTRGGNYSQIKIPNTVHQSFYITAAIASVNYSGGGMDTWVGSGHRSDGAWWLHCYAANYNEVRVKGFRQDNGHNDGWWGGNPLYSSNGSANKITVCIFGYVTFK